MCKISFYWFKFVILSVLPSSYPKILQKKKPLKINEMSVEKTINENCRVVTMNLNLLYIDP